MKYTERREYTKKEIMTDEILKKGHAHALRKNEPRICPNCKGSGFFGAAKECPTCEGDGVLYD